MNIYKVEVAIETVYLDIHANSEGEAVEKANDCLADMSYKQLGELAESGNPQVAGIELSEEGPDTSAERD